MLLDDSLCVLFLSVFDVCLVPDRHLDAPVLLQDLANSSELLVLVFKGALDHDQMIELGADLPCSHQDLSRAFRVSHEVLGIGVVIDLWELWYFLRVVLLLLLFLPLLILCFLIFDLLSLPLAVGDQVVGHGSEHQPGDVGVVPSFMGAFPLLVLVDFRGYYVGVGPQQERVETGITQRL